MDARRSLVAMIIVIATSGGAAAQSLPGAMAVNDVKAERPAVLVPLYLSQAALQGADLYTTRRALAAGHVEANPVFKNASFGTMAGAKVAATVTFDLHR